MKHLSTFAFLILLCSVSHAQSANTVSFSFDHKVGPDSLELDKTIFQIWNGKYLKLIRGEFYISEIELIRQDSSVVALTDVHLLVDATNPEAVFETGEWPVSDIIGIRLHLGVDEPHNHLDPSSYPAGHPLAPQNPTMHWGWQAGYRFMAIEGMTDNNDDGTPETLFEFHNLGDALYKTVELSGVEQAENGVLHIRFTLDYTRLFDGMAMTGNLIQHGSSSFNNKMMTSAAEGGFITMAQVTGTHDLAANALRISAAPNPFASETLIRYDLPARGAMTVLVTNTLGQVVRTMEGLPGNGVLQFEAGNLPNGLYHYAFYDNGQLVASKQMVIGN